MTALTQVLKKASAGNSRRGMASSEALILTGFLIILISAVLPTLRYARQQAHIKQARLDIIEILNGAQRYFDDYTKWPSEYAGEYGDHRYGRRTPNAHVFNPLRAIPGAGNPDHAVNPRVVTYLEPPTAEPNRSGVNKQGDWLDPWGTPYQVVVDTDLNYTCFIDRSTYPPQIGFGMIVWSCGPDRISETEDDILSWALEK